MSGALVAAGVVALGVVSPAAAYTATGGYTVQDFATGFRSQNVKDHGGVGPIGIAFDKNENLYISDVVDGTIYKFPSTGGTAGAGTLFGKYRAGLTGIAFSVDDRMYAADQTNNVIAEISLVNQQVIRTVTTGVKCPTSLAFDPISGDLFASQAFCAGPVIRIENPTSANPTLVPYTSATVEVDGMAFGPDGSLYLVDGNTDAAVEVRRFQGTNGSSPGALISDIANVPFGDGIAFSKPVGGAPPQYLYVNRRDGKITRLDMTTTPPTALDIVTGGTRGDFVTVGADNCLYPTQTATVAKVVNNSICDWFPTHVTTPAVVAAPTPVATPSVATTTPPAASTPSSASSPTTVPPVAAAPSSSTLAQTGAAPWVALLGIGLLGAFLLVRRLRFGRA